MADMPRTARIGIFVLGFLAAIGVEAVRADDAYLCDDGRIVKVAPSQLEEMKRTNACVAAYHGLTIDSARPLETGALAPAPAANARTTEPLTSPVRPAPVAARAQPAAEPALSLVKPITAKSLPRGLPKEPQAAPRAAAGTDFRNVVLLNAGPGAPAIFRHER
jgi:hypothetical protein